MQIYFWRWGKLALILLTILFGFGTSVYADTQLSNSTLSNKQVVKQMFQVFANVNSKPSEFSKYMSSDYVQNADGHTLNYQGFLTHVTGLHSAMKSIHFTFDQIVAEGDVVATHHIAHGMKKDGQPVKTEFFAFFTLKNHKIVRCTEVSRMLIGTAADKNLSYH